jgi:hypothetical protein
MSATLEELKTRALQLAPPERDELIRLLIASSTTSRRAPPRRSHAPGMKKSSAESPIWKREEQNCNTF